jgi:hypothetical protein
MACVDVFSLNSIILCLYALSASEKFCISVVPDETIYLSSDIDNAIIFLENFCAQNNDFDLCLTIAHDMHSVRMVVLRWNSPYFTEIDLLISKKMYDMPTVKIRDYPNVCATLDKYCDKSFFYEDKSIIH